MLGEAIPAPLRAGRHEAPRLAWEFNAIHQQHEGLRACVQGFELLDHFVCLFVGHPVRHVQADQWPVPCVDEFLHVRHSL
ncbi:hypothetical protein [Verminephrobacter aporrectodeae]|uniref:hypothetical protein n=1 Tax=Verminephrobacter aporrectodeae TaxID=1110389 RepID=UPI002244123A|nr:hypothetical protein [Verminephrobacter aporrectodeae]